MRLLVHRSFPVCVSIVTISWTNSGNSWIRRLHSADPFGLEDKFGLRCAGSVGQVNRDCRKGIEGQLQLSSFDARLSDFIHILSVFDHSSGVPAQTGNIYISLKSPDRTFVRVFEEVQISNSRVARRVLDYLEEGDASEGSLSERRRGGVGHAEQRSSNLEDDPNMEFDMYSLLCRSQKFAAFGRTGGKTGEHNGPDLGMNFSQPGQWHDSARVLIVIGRYGQMKWPIGFDRLRKSEFSKPRSTLLCITMRLIMSLNVSVGRRGQSSPEHLHGTLFACTEDFDVFQG
ncbi:hypothetical protein CISG_06657 [Coccidioides immitis RMSCC 3703]|uniref:Uncharacterized protein n=1 Tax=Coccidioides immitis RMSCC 3703 TaxID=454286 RepID=A0A0J8QZC4_COCIT|nr:hypothetical protein CISG_06657 [Coccidioides immitis RMSCC 3703]